MIVVVKPPGEQGKSRENGFYENEKVEKRRYAASFMDFSYKLLLL